MIHAQYYSGALMTTMVDNHIMISQVKGKEEKKYVPSVLSFESSRQAKVTVWSNTI
jgi:hypothetical protein